MKTIEIDDELYEKACIILEYIESNYSVEEYFTDIIVKGMENHLCGFDQISFEKFLKRKQHLIDSLLK